MPADMGGLPGGLYEATSSRSTFDAEAVDCGTVWAEMGPHQNSVTHSLEHGHKMGEIGWSDSADKLSNWPNMANSKPKLADSKALIGRNRNPDYLDRKSRPRSGMMTGQHRIDAPISGPPSVPPKLREYPKFGGEVASERSPNMDVRAPTLSRRSGSLHEVGRTMLPSACSPSRISLWHSQASPLPRKCSIPGNSESHPIRDIIKCQTLRMWTFGTCLGPSVAGRLGKELLDEPREHVIQVVLGKVTTNAVRRDAFLKFVLGSGEATMHRGRTVPVLSHLNACGTNPPILRMLLAKGWPIHSSSGRLAVHRMFRVACWSLLTRDVCTHSLGSSN